MSSVAFPDTQVTQAFVHDLFQREIIPTLEKYISIPNQSPMFDPEVHTNGYQDQVVELFTTWARSLDLQGFQLEVVRLEGRTPLIYIEIDPTANLPAESQTVLLYGHMDKQPPMTETWDEGLHPYRPVIRDGKLYGRGGADDGYAMFSSLAAIKNLQNQQVPHARYVLLIEACEESGSFDLPHYIDALSNRIGVPNLVVCLDSGTGDYERLWLTTSLRGLIVSRMTVKVLNEGVHSGKASGIVPDSFRIARSLLNRIEDPTTGQIIGEPFYTQIPARRIEESKQVAEILGNGVADEFPFHDHCGAVTGGDMTEALLNRAWRPALTVTGADGLPSCKSAGNVLRTHTTLKLSLRVPPHVNAKAAAQYLKQTLESDTPYNATVSLDVDGANAGWEAPALEPWLDSAIDAVSRRYYNNNTFACTGEGGSIPFMGLLHSKFPSAQFVITGVLGPGSNAHGPNEFLHLDYVSRLTCAMSDLLAAHVQAKLA
eukprot:TRINITY_DN163_c0_g1_i1.p1 TRINITY_DN163_c0_g1~~TRINITY_DN163_c0_g1_i1.p1  ORF type:complete len:525 (+),score=204.80 TRINITY_DN163_c0_g1_i1:119-1576(+)